MIDKKAPITTLAREFNGRVAIARQNEPGRAERRHAFEPQ